ncbi:MAG: tRNA pseudouridine(55) synthase TruB [Candidatus Kapabacteria bacterium]|nr:tRNA pseudouridine(55) synthase TruB [Candidatus Kapabacteria bacterium]
MIEFIVILTKDNINDINEWLKSLNEEGGISLLIKEKGWTSFDLVAKLRNLTGIRKIGHSGTLDPLATGLMIIMFGRATKKASMFSDLNKRYLATVKFGARTATYDREMEEEDLKNIDDLDFDKIKNILEGFKGKIIQKPPIYSAKSFKGKKLYKIIRGKQDLNEDIINEIREIKKNEVEIYQLELLNYLNGIGIIDINCSSGTYIRTLVDDIGQKLGTGAYLYDLIRTGIGEFDIKQGFTINEFQNLIKI